MHIPNFEGVSGSADRGGGDNSIQFINIGKVGDKRVKEWRRKIWGGGVGDKNTLTFICYCFDKECDFEKLHFGQFFLFVFVKFHNSWTFLLV